MDKKISRHKLETFLKRQAFPADPDWQSLFLCLLNKQSCPSLDTLQQQAIATLLRATMASTTFNAATYEQITREMIRILNAPYITELQKAIDETDALLAQFKKTAGQQLGEVNRLQELSIRTVQSNKTPSEMVHELKAGFTTLISMMEEQTKIMETLSKTDKLTNLGNRRAFDEYLTEYCQPQKASKLYLIMLDIDNFKPFNDNYGHLVGDEALSLVGTIIKKAASSSNIRGSATNFAARYGGEEFAIIMPNYDDESALKLAEFIRSRIQRYPLVIRNSRGDILKKNIHVTASIGIAEMHPLWLQEPAADQALIKAADQALYAAKKRGRNMICQHKAYPGANGQLTSAIL